MSGEALFGLNRCTERPDRLACNVYGRGLVMTVKAFMRPLLIFLVLSVTCFCCKKEGGGKAVEIYLLANYQYVTGQCRVDPPSAGLQSTPTVRNEDVLAYSQSACEFKLSDAGFQQIKTLRDGTAFAVTVDGEVIYYGFFKPGISSSSCPHSITMDAAWTATNKIALRLGYPGLLSGVTVDDQRNHPTLLTALNQQGKLRP